MAESTDQVNDVKTFCRTCMTLNNTEMFDINSTVGESPKILDMIKSCTSLEFATDDRLPTKICNECFKCLTIAIEFRNRAETADRKLRELITDTETKYNNRINNVSIKEEPEELKVEFDLYKDDIVADDTTNDDGSDNEKLIEILRKKVRIKKQKIKSDDKIKDRKCPECGKSFLKPSKLKIHLRTHNKAEKPLFHKCDTCMRVFDKLSKLARHIETHNPVLKPFQCLYCPLRFKRESLLLSHLITHGNNPIVGTKDIKTGSIKNSSVNIPDSKLMTYSCEVCESIYQSAQSLSAHMRKHKVLGKVLACSLCGKIFKKSSHLKRHERSHDEYRPYKCSQCPKCFLTEKQLLEHVDKHKGVKPYTCPVCTKAFSQLTTLNTHLRIHTREMPYLCPTCGKRFGSSTNLNQHIRRHMGDKSFACKLCPGRFVSKGELQSHMSTHTGVRPFECDTCGSAFTKPNSLAKHKLIHLGIKPHECDVCPMRFSSKDHLKRHYRIHTGEKPYRCDLCERAFTQSNDLVKHKRSHLGDKMYRCSHCSERFRLKTELKKHISTHFVTQISEALPPTSTAVAEIAVTMLNSRTKLELAKLAKKNSGVLERDKPKNGENLTSNVENVLSDKNIIHNTEFSASLNVPIKLERGADVEFNSLAPTLPYSKENANT